MPCLFDALEEMGRAGLSWVRGIFEPSVLFDIHHLERRLLPFYQNQLWVICGVR